MKGIRPDANLTGGQIQTIMDKMLYDSVYLLFRNGFLDTLLLTILSSTVQDRRRKLLSIEYEEGINILTQLLVDEDYDFSKFKNLRLERNLILKEVSRFLKVVESSNYEFYYYRWLRTKSAHSNQVLESVEKQLNMPRDSILLTYHNVQDFFAQFMEFKSSILSQFINLAHKYATSLVKSKNKSLSYDDLFQNIIAAISKAIDKYDSSKGALTSYVKYWIINALNQDNSHVEGLAYEITYNQRKKVASKESNEINFASSIPFNYVHEDQQTPEEMIENKDGFERVLRLIKVADKDGIFRLINNIEEVFTNEELMVMRNHMEKLGLLQKFDVKTQ